MIVSASASVHNNKWLQFWWGCFDTRKLLVYVYAWTAEELILVKYLAFKLAENFDNLASQKKAEIYLWIYDCISI